MVNYIALFQVGMLFIYTFKPGFSLNKGVSAICMDYYNVYKCDNLLIYTFTSQNEYSDLILFEWLNF